MDCYCGWMLHYLSVLFSFSCHQCVLFAVCSCKKCAVCGLAVAFRLRCLRLLPVSFRDVCGEHELCEERMSSSCLPNIVQRGILCVHGRTVCSLLPSQSGNQQLPTTSVRTDIHTHTHTHTHKSTQASVCAVVDDSGIINSKMYTLAV